MAPASANIKEVLSAGSDALLFDHGHDAAFMEGLSTLVEDETLRARLGSAARASLERQNLTWASNATRVEKIAERVRKIKS